MDILVACEEVADAARPSQEHHLVVAVVLHRLNHESIRVLRRRVHLRDCIRLLTGPLVYREPLVAGRYVPRAQLLVIVLIHLLVQSNRFKLGTRVTSGQDGAQVVGGFLRRGTLPHHLLV